MNTAKAKQIIDALLPCHTEATVDKGRNKGMRPIWIVTVPYEHIDGVSYALAFWTEEEANAYVKEHGDYSYEIFESEIKEPEAEEVPCGAWHGIETMVPLNLIS